MTEPVKPDDPPVPPETGPEGAAPNAGYWWQCVQCSLCRSFPNECGCHLAAFIWDCLQPDWNQSLLLRECPKCKSKSLRITYHLQPQEQNIVHVLHIVGVGPYGDYLPMMWETYNHQPGGGNLADPWFHFNYQRGRSPRGLNHPAVLTQSQLVELFGLYQIQAGNPAFLGEL
jgi:hypothetical protein